MILTDVYRNNLRNNLEPILVDLIKYFNRLRIEEAVDGVERLGRIAPRNSKRIINEGTSIITLMQQNTNEPGLKVEDIIEFNTSQTEYYPDFLDRFGEFFNEYGINLFYYDTGEVYIVVEDAEKYLKLLDDLKVVQDQTLKVHLVRKIDRGLEHIIDERTLKSFSHLRGYKEELILLEDIYGKLFRLIPVFIDNHEKIDPNTIEKNRQIRKRLLMKVEAFMGAYLRFFLLLDEYLSPEEVGKVSTLHMLNSDAVKDKFLVLWHGALDRLKISINRGGLVAKPIIDRVLPNLMSEMEALKKKAQDQNLPGSEKDVQFFRMMVSVRDKDLKLLAKMKLEDKQLPTLRPLATEGKIESIMEVIASKFLTSKEIRVLIKKVKKLKPRNKDELPF